ncbi:hypothetical protein MKW98_023187 [Papaver atlanticum]|uniref:Uncharacterized protein n=1 Tax=Papaver atlanticum TaxID=357466 RepID=A0AAD4XH84_9MAGN|nr:hypothetical protein MKW98_023187 [Papaver atlanticum]
MNSIRCCISCILPCGALDVVTIVHSNGKVEEFTRTIRAEDIMKANPKHVLKKPTSLLSNDGDCAVQKIVIVPPDAELQRGKIYFLIPAAASPKSVDPNKRRSRDRSSSASSAVRRANKIKKAATMTKENNINSMSTENEILISDRYLKEILSESKVSSSNHRDRRRGRIGVWRPHLESISEIPLSEPLLL